MAAMSVVIEYHSKLRCDVPRGTFGFRMPMFHVEQFAATEVAGSPIPELKTPPPRVLRSANQPEPPPIHPRAPGSHRPPRSPPSSRPPAWSRRRSVVPMASPLPGAAKPPPATRAFGLSRAETLPFAPATRPPSHEAPEAASGWPAPETPAHCRSPAAPRSNSSGPQDVPPRRSSLQNAVRRSAPAAGSLSGLPAHSSGLIDPDIRKPARSGRRKAQSFERRQHTGRAGCESLPATEPPSTCSRGRTDFGAALRMPLHRHKKPGIVAVVVCFDRLDNPILRAARHNPHSRPGLGNRLVVARVHRQSQETAVLRRLIGVYEGAQHALRCDRGCVSDRHFPSR